MSTDNRTNKKFLDDYFNERMMHQIYIVNALYHYAGLVLHDETGELTAWLDKEPLCYFVNKAAYLDAAKMYREAYDAKYNNK